MRKLYSAVLAAVVLSLAGCSGAKVEDEIQTPIIDTQKLVDYSTANAQVMDLTDKTSVAGTMGYFFQDSLYCQYSATLLEYNVTLGQTLAEGDIIAVFDSSALSFDYNNQKILADSAYNSYAASGSEKSRLNYECEQKKLEALQYEIDRYTLRAPYDCVVTAVERMTVGSDIQAGSFVATVAKPEEVYIYSDSEKCDFHFGEKITIKLNNIVYNGTVIQSSGDAPSGASAATRRNSLIQLDEGEMERLLVDTPNAVSAGWATVYVTTVDRRGVLAIPDSAVKKGDGDYYVYMISNGNRIQIPVTVGASYGGFTIILSGLTEGDEVQL